VAITTRDLPALTATTFAGSRPRLRHLVLLPTHLQVHSISLNTTVKCDSPQALGTLRLYFKKRTRTSLLQTDTTSCWSDTGHRHKNSIIRVDGLLYVPAPAYHLLYHCCHSSGDPQGLHPLRQLFPGDRPTLTSNLTRRPQPSSRSHKPSTSPAHGQRAAALPKPLTPACQATGSPPWGARRCP